MCCCSCWFLTTPERSSGWRSEMRPCVLGMWWGGGGTDRTGLQTDIFKSWFYEPNSCISLYQKSTKVLHGDICSLWLAETFWEKKKICMIAWTLPSPKSHGYWTSHLPLWSSFSAIWGVISLAALLILPPTKRASLTLCNFFKLSSSHKRIQNRGCGWILMGHPYSLNHLDKHAKMLPSCPTLWDPMNCSPPDSSVHRILQARIMECVAISSSRGPP